MSNDIGLIYLKNRRKKYYFLYGTIILLIVSVLFSLCMGRSAIGVHEIYNLITGKADDKAIQIIMNMRMPRIVAALVCCWLLAISGSIIPIILKNPLASPYTLGISNAEAFGASFALCF